MPSPVQISFSDFISIDRKSNTPVYLQIADQIANAVRNGFLIVGVRFPGTRKLSDDLNTHRQTIVAAFNELENQGWIEIRPNKGAFVKNNFGSTRRAENDIQAKKFPEKCGFQFDRSNLLDHPLEDYSSNFVLDDGIPDLRLTHMKRLSSFYSANLKRANSLKKLNNYRVEGSEYFKHQLVDYLNNSRGLGISVSNILVTRSTEMSVFIASSLLLKAADEVVVANLSYYTVNMILQYSGAKIHTVATDENGIDVDCLEQICQKTKIRLVYVTPQRHYPTTVQMSLTRRAALLNLSYKYGFIILEDDYDYEFHYDLSHPLPIASSDREGMVIYSGTFGKSLVPGFRAGFVVAPQDVIEEAKKHLGIIDRQGDVMLELAMGEIIEEGEIHRYLKKAMKIYESRRDNCCAILKEIFGDQISFQKPNGGLAIWTEWGRQVNLYQLSRISKKLGLTIPTNLLYQSKDFNGMRLGFGKFDESEMYQILKILRSAFEEITKNS